MSREVIKSIILTFLVGLSVLLTWNIWTYTPDIAKVNDQSKFIQDEVSIAYKKEVSSLIKPMQMIFHNDEEEHFGTTSEAEINKLVNELSNWIFYDYKNISSSVSPNKIQEFIHKNGMSELIFSDSVPFSLYRQVIEVDDREIPDNIIFDRMLIQPSSDNPAENHVYFLSTLKHQVHKFSVDARYIKTFTQKMYNESKNLDPYKVKEISNNRFLYLPIHKTEIKKYKYVSEEIDKKKFKKVLFPDPSFVKRESISRGEEYMDGKSKMNIYNDTKMLYYTNPSSQRSYNTTSYDLLDRSIQNINGHAGFENNFRYFEMNEAEKETTFRLFIDGLPVYNEDGMSEMVQVLAKDEIYSYSRPIFRLDLLLSNEITSITLPSGEEAYNQIKEVRGFKPSLLENMTIGYRLFPENQSKLIVLEPAWFYKYQGEWKVLKSEQPGGMLDGLE